MSLCCIILSHHCFLGWHSISRKKKLLRSKVLKSGIFAEVSRIDSVNTRKSVDVNLANN